MIRKRVSRTMNWRSLCVLLLLALVGVAPLGAQETSIQEAQKLNQEVEKLYQKGQFSEAIPPARRALAIREQALGPTHPDTATSLNNLALLYDVTGSYEKALQLNQRALTIREQVLGPAHPATAISLNNLAEVYRATGAYTKAEPLYQRALAIMEQVHGPTHPDTASSLNNLAGLYASMGSYDKAEPLYQRALVITEQALGPTHPDTAGSLNNLALLYDDTGVYTKAEPLYQRALAIMEQVGPMHPDTATSLNNLAQLYRTTGAYAKAEPLYQRALAIREETLGTMHPDTAQSLNNLAGLYAVTGAYTKAERLLQRALVIREQVLGALHPDTANSLNNLAGHYYSIGAYDQAEPLYQWALAVREQTLGPTHPDTARSLNNLAGLYAVTRAYTQAEPLLQRALVIREQMLGPTHPDTAQSLNNLAELDRATGSYEKALPLYQRALAITEQALGPTHPDTAGSLNNLAALHWATGHPAAALPLFERSQTIQEKNTAGFLLSGSEARKQAYVQQLRGNTFMNISLSLALLSSKQAAALGLTSILQAKGRVLDAMSDSLAGLRQRVRSEDRKLLEQFTDVVQQQSTLTYQGLGQLPPPVYRAQLSELAAKQEQLETVLSTRSAEFREQLETITLTRVQAALPPDTTLIEWFRYQPFDPKAKDESTKLGKPRYVAYVLSRAGEPAVVDFGEAESIELLVQDFRNALSDPQHTYVKEVAKELSAKLIKPLQAHLGNTQHLLISPDGALNLVPFGALLDDTGHYLATKRDITYLTSGRDVLRFGTNPVARDDVVVVADPDYGPFATSVPQPATAMQTEDSVDLERGRLRFRPLQGTAEEAKALTPLLKVTDTHLLTQAKATEANLKQLQGPRILHIATHGFFLSDKEMAASMLKAVSFSQDPRPLPLGENPLLRSGLALAGANQRRSGEKDDGILTAAEVAQMDLRGTQLVVLSACETGLGEVQNGQGVYGLRRALVLAGAQMQVATLWKVADNATKDLMVDYYQRLLHGEGRSAALRQAQLSMIESRDRSHPYYWAAFVPIGDWRPLAATR